MRSSVFALGGLSVLLIAGGAWAQQAATGGPMVITITKTDCSRLISHTPAPDVAYTPGVDVRGRPVVSADADPARAAFAKKVLPEVLEIPITINPLTYNKAKAANKNKANAATAVSDNTKALNAAKAQGTALASQLSALNTKKSTLASTYASDTAANTASTGGASANSIMLGVRANRQATIDSAYSTNLAKVNSDIASVNSSIATNTSTQSTLTTKDTTLRQTYTHTNMATEGTLAGLSAKGLDSTQMKVGTVKYDIARNTFTFNDEPMISDDQRALAAACAKQGVK